MSEYYILDATASLRSMWIFDKNCPNAVYCDRDRENILEKRRRAYQKLRGMPGNPHIKPFFTNHTIVCDFRFLPFRNGTFYQAVFDPPHLRYVKTKSLFCQRYGSLEMETWPRDIQMASRELWRVLRPGGTLIFKWNDHDIPWKNVIRLFPVKPNFGQISGGAKNRNGKPTHTWWFTFLKEPEKGVWGRECPRCGHLDPPYWRHVRHRLYTDYCRIDELESDQAELAAILRKSPSIDIVFGHYIYRYILKSGIVQRIHISDSRDGKSIREPEQEKYYNRFVPIGQKRLFGTK